MKFFPFCLSWSLGRQAACVPFCIQHFFLLFFFLHFQKDLFLRTDEPHTEKTNRPDCLVLSTHRWGQIFQRAQFPRRYLNKWQILKRGNMPTYFGAQLVLELLRKTCSSMAVLLCLRYKNSKSPSFVPVSLPRLPSCHAPSHRSQLASSCLLLGPSAVIKRSACTYTFPSRGPSGLMPPNAEHMYNIN